MHLNVADPERNRRTAGVVLFVLGCLFGGGLLQLLFLLPPLFARDPAAQYTALAVGAALAFPAVALYSTVPRLLDRYDPEPFWALFMVFTWGALAACGFAAVINTVVAAFLGEQTAAVLSAPIVEEFFKGLAVAAMYYLWRREFDGVVDGIIYGTFVALGFAAVENVVYYSKAGIDSVDTLTATVILRGVVTPWAHPLFTSMTGIGFGLARESARPWLRSLAPLGGYLSAVCLHMLWNGALVLSSTLQVPLALLVLPLWLLFVVAFFVMVIALVARRGRIIRENLQDEVYLRTITQEELSLVGSAFGIFRARMGHNGAVRAALISAIARLALAKWHATRAMQGRQVTVSFDFIVPLRERISQLRGQLGG